MKTKERVTYFNVKLEFNKEKLDQKVDKAIQTGRVGYVCSVESNNLSVANKDAEFLKVLNGALVNNCDGSMLAKILSFVHKKELESYVGADIFISYIRKKKYKQFFLGNTPQVLEGLRKNLSKIDPKVNEMKFETLPFKSVDEFDYEGIALTIEDEALDYIVDKAIEFKLGGRGLRSICELIMTDAMYELPSNRTEKTFVVTLAYAKEKIEKSKFAYLKVA